MTIQRSEIVRGPAIVQMSSQSFHSQGDITVTTRKETFNIDTSAYGKVDERLSNIITDITFTPVGEWEAALLAVMYPHTAPVAGTSMFTSSDVGVTIHPLNGEEKIVYGAAAVTKMPDIILSSTKTAFGEMTITCLMADNTAWTDAAAHYTLTASAAFTDATFSVSNVKTVPYTVAITGASSPWDAVETKDGVTISFNLNSTPVEVDSYGIVDYSLVGLDISVKFTPINVSAAEALTLLGVQGAGVIRGKSLNSGSANITIAGATAGDPSVVVNSCALKTAPQIYGREALRHGELEFVATRTTGSGTMFSVSTVGA